MHNISFALTADAFRNRTKTVTRRMVWEWLTPGTELCGILKGQGLKKGEKVTRLGVIKVVSVRRERLDAITSDDVKREGFRTMSANAFVAMFCRNHTNCFPETIVTRIEFEYVD